MFIPLKAQIISEPVENTGIYSFIDELATDGIIEVNSVVKPYSRKVITDALREASRLRNELTLRQQKELDFFMADFGEPGMVEQVKIIFNPATAQYHDSLFHITVSPLIGLSAGGVTDLGDIIKSWRNGARIYGSYGKLGFYATLQDIHQYPFAGKAEYLTRERGGHIKGGTDFSEMTGGVSYAWEHADISFIKEAPVWGQGYSGTNILSGRAPSFMQIKVHVRPVRWLEMSWIHGWLTSMVVDSARSFWVTNAYGTKYREVYHRKYMAANIFTFTPFRRLKISAGNSVIYSDPRLTPGYLMPLFFYKSVDHSVNGEIDNSNSQMFIDFSSHQVKHLHIFGTLFIDELSTKRFANSEYNFFSWRGGFRTGNFSFLPGIWFTAECTFTYPLTFQHYVPVLTFENQGYNLGHYLRDNTRNYWIALDYKPIRAMNIRLWHEKSERGPDHQSLGGDRVGLPYLDVIEWSNVSSGLEASYMITGGVSATFSLTKSNIRGEESWNASWLTGKTTTVTGGLAWGF